MPEKTDHYVGKITQKAILFSSDEQILLTQCDDHWEPPGGTFEYGETLVGGLRRERREELSIESRVGPLVEAMYDSWIDDAMGKPMGRLCIGVRPTGGRLSSTTNTMRIRGSHRRQQ